MWINLKCKYIMRDGVSVRVTRGEAIPDAEGWPNRDRLARNRFIMWIPDAEYYRQNPDAKPAKAEKPKSDGKPKKKRGRPPKKPEVEPEVVNEVDPDAATPEEE